MRSNLTRRALGLFLLAAAIGFNTTVLQGALRNAPGITLPQEGAIITSAPLSIRIDLPAGINLGGFQATLNGKDITSLFAPPVNQMLGAIVPGLQSGTNVLVVNGLNGITKSSVTFQYNPALRGSMDSTRIRYKPVTTRVLRPGTTGQNPQDFGISVGDDLTGVTTFWAPPFQGDIPSSLTSGFQVVTLGRDSTNNASASSNQAYYTGDTPSHTIAGTLFIPMAQQVASHCDPQHAPNGCILIIQSLTSIGTTGCNNGQPTNSSDCETDLNTLVSWGMAEPFVKAQNNPSVAYSFIGNVSYDPSTNRYHVSPQGLNYERFTCSSASNSDCVTTNYFNLPYTMEGTAPANATADQIGKLSGALVRDQSTSFNGHAYTFTETELPLSYAVVNDPSTGSNTITITTPADPTIDSSGNQYWWSQPPQGTAPPGRSVSYPSKPIYGDNKGIRLFVLDVSNTHSAPTVLFDESYQFTYQNGHLFNLQDLPGTITNYLTSRRCLFIVSILGVISENDRAQSYAGNPYSVNDIWNYLSSAIATIGGDYRTFQMLSRTPFSTPLPGSMGWPAPNEPPDQYILVGYHGLGDYWLNASGRSFATNVAELSTEITRQTVANPNTDPNGYIYNNLNGFLKTDRAGYLEPHHSTSFQGFSAPIISSFQHAANEPSGDWPVCGSQNCTQGQLAAYQFISSNITGFSTNDVRSEYAEFSVDSTQYLLWLDALRNVEPTYQGFTAADFAAVAGELDSELTALATLGDFNTRMHDFFTKNAIVQTDQVITIANTIEKDLQIDNTTAQSSSPEWLQIFNDVVEVAGPAIGFASLNPEISPAIVVGGETAVALLGAVVDTGASTTTTPQGDPLQATEQVEQSLAQAMSTVSTNYASYVDGQSEMVRRIATDANRLNHFYIAKLILAAQNVNPSGSGAFSNAIVPLTLAFKRQIYTKVIAATYEAAHVQYSAPSLSPGLDHNIHNAFTVYNIQDNCSYTGYCVPQGNVCQIGAALYAGHNATMFYPGNLIDGIKSPITIGSHLFPQDLWWDFWGIAPNGQVNQDCPKNENFQQADNNFVRYGLMQPLAVTQDGSLGSMQPLGIYQSYFFNPKRTGMKLLELNTNNTYWSCASNYALNSSDQPPVCYPSNGDSAQ